MSIGLIIRPEAEADLREAYLWYESQRQGLGQELLLASEAALAQIGRFPQSCPIVHRDVRRIALRRFPYNVFYRVDRTTVVVIAIMHAKRDPRRWRTRTE